MLSAQEREELERLSRQALALIRSNLNRKEQPVFNAGDRFRLVRPIGGLADTHDEICQWRHYAAGLKGTVLRIEVYEVDEEDLASSTLFYDLMFDAPLGDTVCYLAYEWHGGLLEQVAAKAVSLE